jgi:hypothetical protein
VIEYTKKQKAAIAYSVFRKLDEDFRNADEHNKLRYSFFQKKYLKFLEQLEIRRTAILSEIEEGIDTQTFTSRMKRHIQLDDTVIKELGLLKFWIPENDEEWTENLPHQTEAYLLELGKIDNRQERTSQAAE